MGFVISGKSSWSCTRDDEGYREYELVTRVKSVSFADGPQQALITPGLPLPGALWAVGNDSDFYAWCRWGMSITPLLTDEPNNEFKIKQKFSTKPLNRPNVPQDNPLLEPPKVSGSFVKHSEEATADRFGFPILTSSKEQVHGPQVEFDSSKATVKIEQNFGTFNFPLHAAFMNGVNDDVLWGLPARCVRLVGISWDRKYYGQSSVYYSRTLEFEIDFKGWDRVILDEGTKVLSGHWNRLAGTGSTEWVIDEVDGAPADPNNPTHYIRFKDRRNNDAKVTLNGYGVPAGVNTISARDLANRAKYFISTVDDNLLTIDTTPDWLEQIDGDAPWDNSTTFKTGNVVVATDEVTGDDFYAIALEDNSNKDPNTSPSQWKTLSNGVNDRGPWVVGTTYNTGDRVNPGTSATTGIGQILVQKYNSITMPLLGIPLTF